MAEFSDRGPRRGSVDFPEEHGRSSTDVIEGLQWLGRMRWLAAAGIAAAVPLVWFLTSIGRALPAITEIGGRPFPIPVRGPFPVSYLALFGLAATVALANVVSSWRLRAIERMQRSPERTRSAHVLANAQIAADLVILTTLAHFLGGFESPVPLYIIFHMVAVTSVLSVRAAYAHSTLGVILLITLANLEFYGVVPHRPVFDLNPPVELHRQADYLGVYFVVLTSMLFFTVFLTNHLANKVRRGQLRLRARALELLSFYNAAKPLTADADVHESFERVMQEFNRVYGSSTYSLVLEESTGYSSRPPPPDGGRTSEPPATYVAPATAEHGPTAHITLRSADRTLGSLSVTKPPGETFEPIEISLLETIAANAALTAANTELYRRVDQEARTDGLTGLVNHRELGRRLEEELAKGERHDRPVSVVMIDVDRFKAYNDKHGHLAGDQLLRELGALLKESVRTGDVVARYGGEEFAVLLPETDATAAKQLAERLRTTLEAHRFSRALPENARSVTASMGVATWRRSDDAPPVPPSLASRRLLQRADEALYSGKTAGRNRVVAAPSPPTATEMH